VTSIEQRKTVTVLFADLVESTTMAEGLDPEALASLLSRYFEGARRQIESRGGTVEKFIGDAVVGVFGVPAVHEDDALRAIRAGLDIQRAIAEMNTEIEATFGVRLMARIGINTGEVAVGGESVALGHAVNMAARLEQAAGSGDVLIGASTYELVGDAVTAESVGPLVVKGAAQPIGAWRVSGIGPTRERGWQSTGPFVGREHELSVIDSAFNDAADGKACVVVTVAAVPGMGKSRLAAEAVARLADRARVLVGRCLPYGEGVTYAALAEIVSQVDEAEAPDAVSRAQQALSIGALASPEETAWAIKELLESLAERQPVAVVVDDLQWAEPLLLDLLDYVATFSVERPILLLCLTRPDLFDVRPEWSAPRPNSAVIRLEPLSTRETEWLLTASDSAALDADTRRHIVDAAGGVPLFVEQMAAFQPEGEGLVPPTIRALLAARVDRLSRQERTALERAAIQGETFDRGAVAALAPDSMRSSLGTLLLGLVRRELIRPERTSTGKDSFRFSHALVRDAVYDQMPHKIRSDLHERYAALLSAENDASARQDVIGHHLERALRERALIDAFSPETKELAVRAGLAIHAAGRGALARKEWQRSVDLLRRARELLVDAPAESVAVLPDLIQALVDLPDAQAAGLAHDEAVTESRRLGDKSTELRAEVAWAANEYRTDAQGWQDRVTAIANAAIEYFSGVGDDASLAYSLLLKAMATSLNMAGAIETLKQAKVHAERAGDERAQIEAWDELGGAMLGGPTPYAELLPFMEGEVAWAREHGIAFTEADGRLGLAYGLWATGDLDGARAALDGIRDLFARLPGFVPQLGECDTLGGFIELDTGNAAAAEPLYRRAMDTFERGGHRRWWRTAAVGLAHTLIALDRVDEAAMLLESIESQEFTSSIRADVAQMEARARLSAAQGDLPTAIATAKAAVTLIESSESPHSEARARELVANLLAESGDARAAQVEFRIANALYAAKGYQPGEARTKAKLTPPQKAPAPGT
jgi:class 3 adenylate cyclase/tetratricopeptide (TPR) repeat protein